MKIKDFIDINISFWSSYFTKIHSELQQGIKKLPPGIGIMYPNIALVIKTKEHFILELLGCTKKFKKLKKKQHKITSIEYYVNQFNYELDDSSTFHFNATNSSLNGLLLSRQVDFDALEKRFKISKKWETKIMNKSDGEKVISFGPEFKSCAFDNCLLINRHEDVYRIKDIIHMRIIEKNMTKQNYLGELDKIAKQTELSGLVYGIKRIDNEHEAKYVLAGQFANAFLIPGLRETTIGKFIEENPEIITKALGSVSILCEKEFMWIEGNPDSDRESIIPDIMLERTDGFYDICDLKLPFVKTKSITTGGHSRRRFVTYVYDGISQLSNYEDYFHFPKNKQLVLDQFGIKVNNPQKYLIVGSYEQVNKSEIDEALRSHSKNLTLIDYDTLYALYLANA